MTRPSSASDPGAGLGAAVRFLLWDYGRGSLAYDLAVLVLILVILLVPGWFWGDPLWGSVR